MSVFGIFCEALFYASLVFTSVFIFTMNLRHKEHFVKRCAIAYTVTAVLFLVLCRTKQGISLIEGWALSDFWFGNAVTSLSVLCMVSLTCKLRWQDTLYASLWAVLQLQLVGEVMAVINHVFWKGEADGTLPFVVAWCILSAAAYFGVYQLVGKKMARDGRYDIGPRQLSSAVILTILIFLLYFIVMRVVDMKDTGLLTPLLLVAQGNCLTIMYMQIDIFRKAMLQKELNTINSLYARQEENYALAKQNIKLINRRCHELKMQIAALRDKTDDVELKKSLQQAEESVRIYDSVAKTGNPILDTLLTEKSLHCNARDIKILCVADGAQLNFMAASDLYALFAEAIENAIDAVGGIEDKSKRMIDVQVYAHQNFLVINITNPLSGTLQLADGVPVSTKQHTAYAGWGVRAMRNIVQKYGGILSTEAKNGMFVLHVVIPKQIHR